MPSIPFVKAEGLGNDFLVVDLRPGKPAAGIPSAADPEVVRALCDRHFGVGGDGVLAILPPVQGDARMRVINADGSEAEMCGNGIRCVAKLLYERDPSLHRPVLRIDTGAGLLECRIDARDGRAETVAVEMGRPQLDPPHIPVAAPAGQRLVRSPLRAGDRQFAFTAVSMGNPHAVIFIDDPAADLRALAEAYGRGIEHDSLFPRRTNVEFARVREGVAGIDLVVWERGCGITLACGTGACATVVAACLEGRAAPAQEIPVHLPGGTLFIRVASQVARDGSATYTGVSMRGPARIVFEAEIDSDQIVKS
ncbi:MAG TPA: diaminopimelate epimerase [Polyangia bacterium]|jgi:diaminopimelate epimerase|nr:diaminopimelate epimerase [Polyangia bacterium]